ncbi:glycoside hydrolase family 6 protein [Glaciihabitans tibetensis]|uniref:glycoside hydrolase family 6 protein n=1 Tax=Glaciihabitans tibetensis TaxID=1266600 RepID=UPI0015E6857D|nr:glycoside hydrolase family 6 protein [Glaciihabitans tibetensis]
MSFLSLVAVAVWAVVVVVPRIGESNPLSGQQLYVYPESSASLAAQSGNSADAAAIAEIANTPAAIWVLPEVHPTDKVAAFVDSVALAAEAENTTPVFVVYGIPDRDCQSESAGGLSAEEYPAWVSAIGTGLLNHASVVILEPDSLSLATECGNLTQRVEQVRDAASRLVDTNLFIDAPGPAIYLDGGHSSWLDAQTMAGILRSAGIDKVQGFASNTSNFNDTASEVAYANELSSLTGNAHYVIDTSRNGNGSTSSAEWCNPSGRALGDTPGAVEDGGAYDGNLWIKNPGESDGKCNGGPAAGEWWQAGALALVRAS